MVFEVTLADSTIERVEGADSFQQEGPLTTFFGTDGRRRALDCWSTKVASFRTDRIMKIRRLAEPAPGTAPGTAPDRARTTGTATQPATPETGAREAARAPDHEVRTFANAL